MRFRLRRDLQVTLQEYGGELCYVVRDPVTLAFYRFSLRDYRLLDSLRGQTVAQLCDELAAGGAARPSEEELTTFLGRLVAAGIVVREGALDGQVYYLQRQAIKASQRLSLVGSLLYIRFPGFDPDRLLTWLHAWLRWLFSPLAVLAAVVLVVLTAAYTYVHFDEFLLRIQRESLESFFSPLTLVWLWLTIGVVKVLHEFGHGLACKHFGGECHEMGALLMVFSPALYCDATDAWKLTNKWHRIIISSAGIYVELVLASLAAIVWWNTTHGAVHSIALVVMALSSLSTVLINANPLMRFDGYYILSDLMEIPNLREKAQVALQSWVDRSLLGLATTNSPRIQRGRGLFVAFAIASWLYRWFLTLGILYIFYHLLQPYRLGSVSIALAVLVGLQMIVRPLGNNFMRVIEATKKQTGIRWFRPLVTAVVLAGLMVAAVFVPVPRRVRAALFTRVAGERSVFVPVSGRLHSIEAQAGDRVDAGDVLVRLENPDLDREILHLEYRLKSTEIAAQRFAALKQPGEEQSQLTLRDAIIEQLQTRRAERDRLLVRAEIAGEVLATPTTPISYSEREGYADLQTRDQEPLQDINLGSLLSVGTPLCRIAPRAPLEAVMIVEQSEVTFLRVGQRVLVSLDAHPTETLSGTVSEIGRVQAEALSPQLMVHHGGELPTKIGPRGEMMLASPHYQVLVELDDQPVDRANPGRREQLFTGLRGRGRVDCGRWTCWEVLQREFHKLVPM